MIVNNKFSYDNSLIEEDVWYDLYCGLYVDKFGKSIIDTDKSKEEIIDAIKICLDKNEDLLESLLKK